MLSNIKLKESEIDCSDACVEDRGSVITADKVSLPPAERQVLELPLVSSSLVKSQPPEEIEEQLFLL